MRVLTAVFNFYIKASFHVSAGLTALVKICEITLGIDIPMAYYGMVFLLALAGYNFLKYGAEPGKYGFLQGRYLRSIQIVSIAGLFPSLWFALQLPQVIWPYLLLCGLLIGCYALPFLPGLKSLRNFGILKLLIVALVWSLVVYWIPLKICAVKIQANHSLEYGMWTLFVFAWMVPFEIRDMTLDDPRIRTLPQRFGISTSKRLAMVLLTLFLAHACLTRPLVWEVVFVKGLLGILTGLAVAFTHKGSSKYYASFWVEGIPILILGVCWLLGI